VTSTVAFEDRTPENLKIAPISDRAFRLWFNAACYCHRNLTDGRVPAVLILSLSPTATKRAVEELLSAGLLERVDKLTYRVHDYLDHNPSREEVEEARRGSRERTRRWRDGARDSASDGGGDASQDARVTEGVTASVPVNVTTSDKKRSTTTETSRATEETLLVVDRLVTHLLERDPQAHVEPRSDRWLRAARLLLTADGRSVEQVTAVLEWLPTDPFWPTVILSMPKLREKFTQLVAKMNAASGPVSVNGRQSPSDLLRKLNEAEVAS
jgi:hypothetical protein